MTKTNIDPAAAVAAGPPGLVLRPYTGEGDLPALARIENAENEADKIPARLSVGELTAHYSHPSEHFDSRRDVVVAELEGSPVAFGSQEWIDTTDGLLREYRVGGAVHPDHRRRGIGTAILRHNEAHARRLAAGHATERSRVLGAFSGEHQAGTMALLAGAGYGQVRWFFDMVRPSLEEVPDVPLPVGLEVRPVTPDLYKQIWDADVQAFQDHWGGFDASDQAMRRFLEAPSFDPSLWVIAFDGGEVAGGVVNAVYPEENTALGVKRGWLDSVFTRRAWRRRGLARALIARSLSVLRERGLTSAALGVDADNPSGALGLYESVGFAVAERFTAWRRPLEPDR